MPIRNPPSSPLYLLTWGRLGYLRTIAGSRHCPAPISLRARPHSETFSVQPLPESLISEFAPILLIDDWGRVRDSATSTEMVENCQAISRVMVDQCFPWKTVTVRAGELPYLTEDLKKLRRLRDRTYGTQGRSPTFIRISEEFEAKNQNEAQKYKAKIIEEVREGKRGSGYSAIRKLGDCPGSHDRHGQFTVPSYQEEGLTALEAANRLADYLSSISQTVQPLDENGFHPALRLAIMEGRKYEEKPILSQHRCTGELSQLRSPTHRYLETSLRN